MFTNEKSLALICCCYIEKHKSIPPADMPVPFSLPGLISKVSSSNFLCDSFLITIAGNNLTFLCAINFICISLIVHSIRYSVLMNKQYFAASQGLSTYTGVPTYIPKYTILRVSQEMSTEDA